jgi:hypothetical protein
VTYNSELTDESREGDRLISLPLLVLYVRGGLHTRGEYKGEEEEEGMVNG